METILQPQSRSDGYSARPYENFAITVYLARSGRKKVIFRDSWNSFRSCSPLIGSHFATHLILSLKFLHSLQKFLQESDKICQNLAQYPNSTHEYLLHRSQQENKFDLEIHTRIDGLMQVKTNIYLSVIDHILNRCLWKVCSEKIDSTRHIYLPGTSIYNFSWIHNRLHMPLSNQTGRISLVWFLSSLPTIKYFLEIIQESLKNYSVFLRDKLKTFLDIILGFYILHKTLIGATFSRIM